MVSGLVTSPYDHDRISSGEATDILIPSKSLGMTLTGDLLWGMRLFIVLGIFVSFLLVVIIFIVQVRLGIFLSAVNLRQFSVFGRFLVGRRSDWFSYNLCQRQWFGFELFIFGENLRLVTDEVNIEPQALQFPYEYQERRRNRGLLDGLVFNDRFVGFAASVDVIGLYGKHFL